MGQIRLEAWGLVTTIEYPNDMDSLIPAAFGSAYGYEEEILDEDENLVQNPQSLEEFTVSKIFDYVSDIIRTHGIKSLVAEARREAEEQTQASMDQMSISIEN